MITALVVLYNQLIKDNPDNYTPRDEDNLDNLKRN